MSDTLWFRGGSVSGAPVASGAPAPNPASPERAPERAEPPDDRPVTDPAFPSRSSADARPAPGAAEKPDRLKALPRERFQRFGAPV